MINFNNYAVLSKNIEPYGIVRIGYRNIPKHQYRPQDGAKYYADAFLRWRKQDPKARVEIVPSDDDSLFKVTFKDGSSEVLQPIDVLWVDIGPGLRKVCKGGYILHEGLDHLADELLLAERGIEPKILYNSTNLRYPRDRESLQRTGWPADAPVGQSVMVMYLNKWKTDQCFRVFTPDERLFPFEIAPDLVSFSRWGRRPSDSREELFEEF